MFGYNGQYLEIDLTEQKINKLPLSEDLLKKYIGGSGIGAVLYANYISEKRSVPEALSPDNPLIFMTGPLTGSTFPASPRIVVCSRSPLTNIWGEANAGGHWGAELKKAGYDGIFVKGKATEPLVIYIENDNVELAPAGDLWGKDVHEVQDQLKEKGKVACIGPAGENVAALASIAVSKHNFFGRAGLGAVMGSKNLKAIVVKGNNKYTYADADLAKEVKTRMIQKIKGHPFISDPNGGLSAVGSNGIAMLYQHGDVPIKNWQMGRWTDDQINGLSAATFKEKFGKGHSTCFACPVACKTNLSVDDEKYNVSEAAGPEYETVAGFGSLVLNDNPAVVAKANELCNRYGMDTISTAAVIALAMECFERGYIIPLDTDGMVINWGDGDIIIELLHQIGQNKGFGARLANGSDVFVAELDKAAKDCVTTVKGLEAPFHEARLCFGQALDYSTGYRGACHMSSTTTFTELGMVRTPKIFGEDPGFIPPCPDKKPELVKKAQDYGVVFGSAACFCYFGGVPYNEDELVDSLNAATGFGYTLDDIMLAGERIWCLKRTLSNLWGVRKEQDNLPKRLVTPLADGPLTGLAADVPAMREEYYKLRGLDNNGILENEILEKCEVPQYFIKILNELRDTSNKISEAK